MNTRKKLLEAIKRVTFDKQNNVLLNKKRVATIVFDGEKYYVVDLNEKPILGYSKWYKNSKGYCSAKAAGAVLVDWGGEYRYLKDAKGACKDHFG